MDKSYPGKYGQSAGNSIVLRGKHSTGLPLLNYMNDRNQSSLVLMSEEIDKVVKSMNPNTAPGPDGFYVSFLELFGPS